MHLGHWLARDQTYVTSS